MSNQSEEKVLVLLEGQQHWVRASIAQDDTLLRQLLSPLSPELAAAEIQREGSKITVVPRKGTKGMGSSTVLAALDAAPSEIDPAIAMCLLLQRIELQEGINPQRAGAIRYQIETAIAQSTEWAAAVRQTLQRLDGATSITIIPPGF